MEIYFDKEASQWEETLPIGNGILGGMIWGKVEKEIIGLNDCSFWSGTSESLPNVPNTKGNLGKIQNLILDGKRGEAEKIIQEKFLGFYTESYLPLGNLVLDFCRNNDEEIKEYRRCLSIDKSLVNIHYKTDRNEYKREIFASYPDQSIVLKMEHLVKMKKIKIFFDSEWKSIIRSKAQGLLISVQAPERVQPSYIKSIPPIKQGKSGEVHKYEIIIQETDGEVFFEDDGLAICNSKELVLVFKRFSERKRIISFNKLKQKHILDYKILFNNVQIELGNQIDLPMDQRLSRLRDGNLDPGLIALYFQYNRYLLISCSRPNGFPANLQGIWCWQKQPPWSSNYTLNINFEMNYWGADIANLSECMIPYVEFINKLILKGKDTAKLYYGLEGSVVHHNSDKWYSTNPVGKRDNEKIGDPNSLNWAMWPMGGVWLVNDLYRHYEYIDDKSFLKTVVYPCFCLVTKFLTQYLVESKGFYHSAPSTSPENTYIFDEKEYSVDKSSTMDITLIKENFEFFCEICETLEIKTNLLARVRYLLPHLPQVKIGKKGEILEWQEEFKEAKPGHRHFSHLYGAFPSEQFSTVYFEAVKKAIEIRLENGGGHTGWSNAWLINLYAVLGKGDLALDRIKHGLKYDSYNNLWSSHPPFQIDGNFGNISGIANLFVQCRKGEIKLLPALPQEFSKGYIKGLNIKKNRYIELKWENGEIIFAKIYKEKMQNERQFSR